MKKTIFTSSATILLAALACSNEKDPQPAPKSRTELLTSHGWRPVSKQDSVGKYMPLRECDKDNWIYFQSDNNLVITEGDSICKKGEDSPRENKWYFQDNDTKIWFYRTDYTATILKLTEDSLIIRDDDDKSISKVAK